MQISLQTEPVHFSVSCKAQCFECKNIPISDLYAQLAKKKIENHDWHVDDT